MLEVTPSAAGYVAAEVVWEVSFLRAERDGRADREKHRRETVGVCPFIAVNVSLVVAEGAMLKRPKE